MPTLTIDGQEVNIAAGSTVIQAAEKLGIYIPRYCYHPGLSVAGSCRMCMVEIDKIPKLQISCYTPVREGMSVSTDSEAVRKGRRDMLEFLLTNHPLDCPVCDQSGECDLQNFYMAYGRYESRFLEDKIKRLKAHPLGPHVVLDQERCILCSRCTRFTEEVSKTHELGIFNRGNRSVVDLHPNRTLDNPYSGNVIDICPVGALTERQFRFRCRVWYLKGASSICSGCSRGCNISIQYNGTQRGYKAEGRRVQRYKPRFNPEVNRWWMCDEGRFGFEFIDQNRIESPHLRRSQQLQYADWSEALEEVSKALQAAREKLGPESIGVIASPQLSNEELFLIDWLFGKQLGVTRMGWRNPAETEGFEDDFLIRGDKNPNSRGAQEYAFPADAGEILRSAADGEVKILYVFGHNFEDPAGIEALEKAEYVVFQGANWNATAERAHAVLAGVTHAEKEGTFTNFEGRVQRFEPAFPPLEESRDDIEILLDLAQKLGFAPEFFTAEEIFEAWQGKRYEVLEEHGRTLDELQG